MNTSSEVDAWFAQLDHPLKPVMQRVREIILEAHPRMSEVVQYGTVQFVYVSAMCTFVQVKDTKRVSLMFHAAGRLAGSFPHLEGKSVKHMRFRDLAETEACANELREISAAWREYKGSESKQQR